VRESPALDIIELLRAKGADVRYHDPYVPSIHHNGFEMTGEVDLYAALAGADCAVLVTRPFGYAQDRHREYTGLDPRQLKAAMRTPALVDGRNVFDGGKCRAAGMIYRAVGKG